MREAEARCFEILERELSAFAFSGARTERRPMNPDIQSHPHYSLPQYTKSASHPRGLPVTEAYAGRSNLIFIAPGTRKNSKGSSIALNAHLDVVVPYFPPSVKGDVVFGRGACDDKGPLVVIVAALKILAAILQPAGLPLNKNIVAMFVIDEEIGGNGSLSLAIDRELRKSYDSMLVIETCGLKIHPANRGAVWYRAELRGDDSVSAFEMAAFVIEEMEKEGAAIRAESRHPLFPQRPVQTNHGMLGPFGETPSRICGEVKFEIRFERQPGKETENLVRDCIESGLAAYVGLYGDKSKVIDSASGKPLVPRHYDLRRSENGFEVSVHGATGHMGAIRERDGAITKAATLLRSLIASKAKLETSGGAVQLKLCESKNATESQSANMLVLEGGQGFLPTHGMSEVMERMRRAVERGAENYLRHGGRNDAGSQWVTVTYDKLHNAAFDGDLNSPVMRDVIAAAKDCKLLKDEPIVGYPVSCDARLFAVENPGMPVVTFGPGELAYAHSDQEQIALKDVLKAVEFLALFLARHTGTI